MKLFHRKFINNEPIIDEDATKVLTKQSSRLHYFFNQFLIWFFIISIVLFVLTFLDVDIFIFNKN